MNLSEFIEICQSNEKRHINIIGEYADEIKPKFSTADQWREFIKSNSEFSKRLSPFDDDQLSNAMKQVKSAGYLEKYTLETLHKFLVK